MARNLRVEIIGDPSSYSRALSKASKDTSAFGGKLATLGGHVGRFAKGIALVGGAAGVGGFLVTMKRGIDEAGESAKVMAQTNAVLKSTHGIANLSAKAVGDLATQLSQLTGVDDENIQAGENWLLTFKNIRDEAGKGNDIFTQTTKVTLDLAAAQAAAKGTTIDMASASTIMGKALNDPVKGISALTRVGVTFTQAQKEQIAAMVKAGDVLGAQKIILGEVRSQVEGSAKAYGETFPGQIAKLKNAFDEVAGSLLQGVTPALANGAEQLAGFLQEFQNADGASAKFKVLTDGLQNVATDVFAALQRGFNAINWNAVWAGVKINAQALVDKFNAALAAADWTAIGRGVGTAITKTVSFAGDLKAKLTQELATAARNIDWASVGRAFFDGFTGSGGPGSRLRTALGNIWKIDKATFLGPSWTTGEAMRDKITSGFTTSLQSNIKKLAFTNIVNGLIPAINSAAAAGRTLAETQAAGIGGSLAAGIASGFAAKAVAAAWAIVAQVQGILAIVQNNVGSQPDVAGAKKLGIPLAQGMGGGFVSELLNQVGPMVNAIHNVVAKQQQAVRDAKAKYADAFRQLAEAALAAFDAKVAAWVNPAQKMLDKINADIQHHDVQNAVDSAQAAAKAAADAYTGATQQDGESDADFAARKADLYQKVLETDAQLKDAQRALLLQGLQDQADDVQKAHDDRVAKERAHLEALIRMYDQMNGPMRDAGQRLTDAFAQGFDKGIAEVIRQAKRLARELEKITGPVGTGGSKSSGSGPSKPPDVGKSIISGSVASNKKLAAPSSGKATEYHVHVGTVIGSDLSKAATELAEAMYRNGRDGGFAPSFS